jgi:uncharacterized protein (DUF302 family)
MSVDGALARLESTIAKRGLRVFARIDFSGDAANAGLKMQDAKMLVFGNPKAGTPVIVAAPTSAIDLPLKVLVWRDAKGDVWFTYNDPEYVAQRHGVPHALAGNISGVAAIVAVSAEMEAAA